MGGNSASKLLETADGGRHIRGFRMQPDYDRPQPKDGVLEYNVEDIQTRLEYARALKGRHNVTPRQLALAHKYKVAAANALNTHRDPKATAGTLVDAYQAVFELDKWAAQNKSAFLIPSELAADLMRNVWKLKQTEFYCRHEGYLKGAKDAAKEHRQSASLDTDTQRAYWKEVQDKIVAENSRNGPKPVTMALRIVADTMGIDPPRLFRACESYAARDPDFRSGLDELFAQGATTRIACTLYHDFKDLFALFPDEDKEEPQRSRETKFFRRLILAWQYAFFRPSRFEGENDPDSWTPKAEVSRLLDDAMDGQDIYEPLRKTLDAQKRDLENRLRDLQMALHDLRHGTTTLADSHRLNHHLAYMRADATNKDLLERTFMALEKGVERRLKALEMGIPEEELREPQRDFDLLGL